MLLLVEQNDTQNQIFDLIIILETTFSEGHRLLYYNPNLNYVL